MHMASRNCQHRFSLYHLTTEKTGAFKLKEDSLRYKKTLQCAREYNYPGNIHLFELQ